MLILVPWKPFVFGWLLLTAMILAGYAVYCLQERRNPFAIEKYHVQQFHALCPAGHGSSELMATANRIRRPRRNRTINSGIPDGRRPRQALRTFSDLQF